jgi:hypothetical protein
MSIRIRLAIGVALFSLTACSSDEPTTSTDSSPSSPTAPTSATPTEAAYDGPTIPDGDYQRVITQKVKRRLGITLSDAELEFAPDGTLTNVIRILGDQWVQLANNNGDPPTVGSQGTLSYDQEGRLIVDEPCCGNSRYTWKLHGDKLTLLPDIEYGKAEHPGFDPNSQDVRVWKMLSSGIYTRVR